MNLGQLHLSIEQKIRKPFANRALTNFAVYFVLLLLLLGVSLHRRHWPAAGPVKADFTFFLDTINPETAFLLIVAAFIVYLIGSIHRHQSSNAKDEKEKIRELETILGEISSMVLNAASFTLASGVAYAMLRTPAVAAIYALGGLALMGVAYLLRPKSLD